MEDAQGRIAFKAENSRVMFRARKARAAKALMQRYNVLN
jgi:hypothetical protein